METKGIKRRIELISVFFVMMLFVLAEAAYAADPVLKSSSYGSPDKGWRLPAKYANHLSILKEDEKDEETGKVVHHASKLEVINGSKLSTSSVRSALSGMDDDYADRHKLDPDTPASFKAAIGVQAYDAHISDAGSGKELWFKLDNESKGNLKLKITGLKWYNAETRAYDYVDLVYTITDWTDPLDGRERNAVIDTKKGKFLATRMSNGGLPMFYTARVGRMEVDYDFYEAGTKTAKPLDTNITFIDVDTHQSITFSKGTSGNIPYIARDKNSNLSFTNSSGNYRLEDTNDKIENRQNVPEDAFAIYLEKTSGYKLKFQSTAKGNGAWSFFSETAAGMAYPEINPPYKTVAWGGDSENAEGETDTHENGDRADKSTSAIRQMTGDQLNKVKLGESRGINDAVTPETLKKTVTFRVRHPIANAYQSYDGEDNYFDSYVITDEVDDAFDIVEAKMASSADREGFTVNVSGNTVTATAKASRIGEQGFYNAEQHTLIIKVKLKAAIANGDYSSIESYYNTSKSHFVIPNKAKVDTRDGATQAADKGYQSKETNTTNVIYEVPRPKIRKPSKQFLTGGQRGAGPVHLGSTGEKYTYLVRQPIESGYSPVWYFDSFVLRDAAESYQKIDSDSIAVYRYPWKDSTSASDYAKGENVTGWFTRSVSGTTVSMTANSNVLDGTQKAGGNNFYTPPSGFDGWVYELRFDANIDPLKIDTAKEIAELKTDKAYEYVKDDGSKDEYAKQNVLWSGDPGQKTLRWPNQANTVIGTPKEDHSGNETFDQPTQIRFVDVVLPEPAPPAIEKTVTDYDTLKESGEGPETRVTQNTVRHADDHWTYELDVRVDKAYAPGYYFTSFEIKDTIEDILVFTGTPKVEVLDSGKNVVKKFDASEFPVTISGKTITAKAGSAILGTSSFHDCYKEYTGSTASGHGYYRLTFDVRVDTENYDLIEAKEKIDRWLKDGGKSVHIPNSGKIDTVNKNGTGTPNARSKTSNNTNTIIHLPTDDTPDGPGPGLAITKKVEPYEFQVGDAIPYTITIRQMNPKAAALDVDVHDNDFPEGFVIDRDSIKAEISGAVSDRKEAFDPGRVEAVPKGDKKGDGFRFRQKYLYYGEKVTITFTGRARKELNGKVVPNTVHGRAWGVPWKHASDSIYINSPKMDITKEVEGAEVSEDGKVEVKQGESIQFRSVIKNVNPGTFMRNLYVMDTSETEGFTLDPDNILIRVKPGDAPDLPYTLVKGEDYKIVPWKDGETRIGIGKSLGKGGFTLDRSKDTVFDVKTSAESADSEGEELPRANHGGFLIKFFGEYRNMGYQDLKIPAAWSYLGTNHEAGEFDAKGKNATYLHDDLKAIEQANGIAYTKDYENLGLMSEIEISYKMTATRSGMFDLSNFIKVFATSNTNGDLIHNDDNLPIKEDDPESDKVVKSGGDFARSSVIPEPAKLTHEKSVEEETTYKDEKLHYRLTSKNSSTQNAHDVVITDGFTSGNALMDKDVKVFMNKKDITSSCEITYEPEGDEATGFKAELKDNVMKPNDEVVVEYTGTCTSNDPQRVDNVTILTSPSIEEELKDEEKVPIQKKSDSEYTAKDMVHGFGLYHINDSNVDWESFTWEDSITTKNAKIDADSFELHIGDKKISEDKYELTISEDGYSFKMKVNERLPKGFLKASETTLSYKVTAEDDEKIINEPGVAPRNGRTIKGVPVEIPPLPEPVEPEPAPDHKKSVREEQHDGPNGQINTLHYTLNSKNNGRKDLKNVVITDEILTRNLTYNQDVKVVFADQDITSKCKISYEGYSFRIETGMDLPAGETIVTTYSGKVTNKAVVGNETVLRADGIDGIYDWKYIPGPEDGVFVTTRKTSEPPSGSVVKAGDIITYILTATNSGKDVSDFTQIRDRIPEGTSFVSVHDGGAYVEDGNYCEWVVSKIKPGESKRVTFKVKVNDDPPKEIWNVATYRSTKEDPGKPGEIKVDPENRTEETVHYTEEEHDEHVLLRAKKDCDPKSGSVVSVGNRIKYMITIENYGDKATDTAGIRDYIPDGTRFISSENGGIYNQERGSVDWRDISLKAGESRTYSFTVEVIEKAVKLGEIENQALYQNDWTDPSFDPSSSTNKVVHVVKEVPETVKIKSDPDKPNIKKTVKAKADPEPAPASKKVERADPPRPGNFVKTGDSKAVELASILSILAAALLTLVLLVKRVKVD